ncbi:MAG TPA: hypothetical protein ENH28_01415 [Euryarchaeota archaeon]|nr:hypothetical protein [Euryarchaeota archaeon]
MLEGRGNIEIEFDSPEEADIVYGSVAPEHISSPHSRGEEDFKKLGKVIYLFLKGDSSAFRASLSSYLRWIKLSYSLMEEDL